VLANWDAQVAVRKVIEYANREGICLVKILAALMMTLMPALVLGSNARASKSEILSIVETAAKASCHNPEPPVHIPVRAVDQGRLAAYKFSRCVSTARFDVPTNTWNVMVGYVYKDENGKEVFPMGAWTMYILSPAGKLLQTLPGA